MLERLVEGVDRRPGRTHECQVSPGEKRVMDTKIGNAIHRAGVRLQQVGSRSNTALSTVSKERQRLHPGIIKPCWRRQYSVEHRSLAEEAKDDACCASQKKREEAEPLSSTSYNQESAGYEHISLPG